MTLQDYGILPEIGDLPGIPARVVAQHRERYEIVCEHGAAFARLKTKDYYWADALFPTVGDYVAVNYLTDGDSQILATLPRHSCFSRREPGSIPRDQAVAANFDYVLLLQSMNQNYNPRRLERYLILARQSGATPVIVLTKADLTSSCAEYVARTEQLAPGVAVHAISAATGFGLDGLAPYLRPGKTIVFLGSSGVGKSSLVNALAGEELMSVGGIREVDGRGRHTTTHRQLVRLPSGALIIDTPGMRELGMAEASEGLSASFADVEQYLGKCRFADCSHTREPGCAIRNAIETGALDPARWESYRKLQAESKSHADAVRVREETVRRKREWSKNVALARKRRKQTPGIE